MVHISALARRCFIVPAGYSVLFCCAALFALSPAAALDVPDDEWPRLKACEKDLCGMVLTKQSTGPDLKCSLSKTWAQDSLNGGKKSGISWVFGDARCATSILLTREDILSALTKPKHVIQIPEQTVKCVVERSDEIKPVTIKLAPKLVFKGGKADKVWINVKEIEGPEDVKGTVWTAASLEDTLGLFHKPMLKSINKFLYQRCEKKYGPNAKPDDEDATTAGEETTKPAGKRDGKTVAKAATHPPQKPETQKPLDRKPDQDPVTTGSSADKTAPTVAKTP